MDFEACDIREIFENGINLCRRRQAGRFLRREEVESEKQEKTGQAQGLIDVPTLAVTIRFYISKRRTHLAEATQEKSAADTKTDKLYKAEYIGSGTFIISKPKRKKIKMRQTQLKNPKRGSRK